jgi:metal-sulfur cluster biosynthetic enzyme
MNEELVRNALRSVLDPEIGVNIVDLGLIYQAGIEDQDIWIEMTMTTPTCPLHSVIERNIIKTLETKFPEAERIKVELVWDPPWKPEMMSQNARQVLGWNS